MRTCPYCGGPMDYVVNDWGDDITVHENTLACLERCQHRICQNCGIDIHRGSKDDPNYYDNNGNNGCYEQCGILNGLPFTEIVDHQP